jgi:hypothetical protein
MSFEFEEDVNNSALQSGFEFFVLPLENSVEWLNLKKDIELLGSQPNSPFQDLLDEVDQVYTLIRPLFMTISKNYKNKAIKSSTIIDFIQRCGKKIDEKQLFRMILEYTQDTLAWTFMPRKGQKFWLKPIMVGTAKIIEKTPANVDLSPNLQCILTYGFKSKSNIPLQNLELICENKHSIFDFHPDFPRNHLLICPHCNSPTGKFYLLSNLGDFFIEPPP